MRKAHQVMISMLLGIQLIATVGCEGEKSAQDTKSVITVWAHHGRPAERDAMQSIVDAFNEAHHDDGLHVEVTFYPDQQYADKVSIAAVSGTLPDVLDIDGPYVGPWAADGFLVSIDDHVDESLRRDMLPSLIDQGTYNGKLYALGAFDSALVVYYNRDIVDKAGLSPPESPDAAWAWDEFVAALARVKPHATIPLSLHMDDQSDEWFTYAFSPLIWSNGGRLIDTESHQAAGVLNGPNATEAIQEWRSLFDNGLAEPTTTNPDPFSAGLAAFDWTGHWMLPKFQSAESLRFGVMPLPRMGEKFVAASGSWCWGISRDCKTPNQAWQFIAWLLDPHNGIKPIVDANGAVPGRTSAFELFPEYKEMPRKLFRAQLEAGARARPRTPVYLTLTSSFAAALRDIANGADVQDRLSRAAENVQRTLDRR